MASGALVVKSDILVTFTKPYILDATPSRNLASLGTRYRYNKGQEQVEEIITNKLSYISAKGEAVMMIFSSRALSYFWFRGLLLRQQHRMEYVHS